MKLHFSGAFLVSLIFSPWWIVAPVDAAYQVKASELEDALSDLTNLTAPLANQDALNKVIPFVGKSINELIGGAASDSIAKFLDFSNFTSGVGATELLDRTTLVSHLVEYLANIDPTVDILAGDGCNKTIDFYEGTTELKVVFCALFNMTRTTTLDGDGLFDNLDEVLEVDLDANVSASATLLFKASMSFESVGPSITMSPIEACFDLEGDVDTTVGVGVLDLLSSATAAADACFKLEYCDQASCPSSTSGEQLGSSNFYLERSSSYKLNGSLTIGSPFPGLTLGGDATFSIIEDDIFDFSPNVTFENFNFSDFITFSPENAVAMLRLIDSTFVRAQENEAFDVSIPLTDTSVSAVLATGSVLTTNLLKLFQKVEPFDDRAPSRSLFITQETSMTKLSSNNTDTLQGLTWVIYVLEGNDALGIDLNVNPDNQEALQGLIEESGTYCFLTFSEDPSTNDVSSFKDLILEAAAASSNCTAVICDVDDCEQDDDTGDIFNCACEVVIGVTDTNLTFIGSVAYEDADKEIAKDIQLIGFMLSSDESEGPTSVFTLPVNQPSYPALIPRFRNFEDFTTYMAQAISESLGGIVDAQVTYEYIEAMDTEPAQYSLTTVFSKSANMQVGLNSSTGIGDLIDLTVRDGSEITISVEASFSTTFGVLMEPDDTEELIILGNACNGTAGFNCTAASLLFYLRYVDDDIEHSVNKTISATSTVTQSLSDALDGIATVTERGTAIVAIRFAPTVSEVKLLVPKVRYECVS